MKSDDICFLGENYDKPRQCVEKQRHYSAIRSPYCQGYSLPSGHKWLWELECRRIDAFNLVLEKTLEHPLDSKKIKPVHPKGNQPWIFIGRTDASAPMLWPLDTKSQLIRKDPGAGKDWRQEKKGDNRGQDGWIVSLTQWTWGWASSGRRWRTGKPGVLQSMGSQRVGYD